MRIGERGIARNYELGIRSKGVAVVKYHRELLSAFRGVLAGLFGSRTRNHLDLGRRIDLGLRGTGVITLVQALVLAWSVGISLVRGSIFDITRCSLRVAVVLGTLGKHVVSGAVLRTLGITLDSTMILAIALGRLRVSGAVAGTGIRGLIRGPLIRIGIGIGILGRLRLIGA